MRTHTRTLFLLSVVDASVAKTAAAARMFDLEASGNFAAVQVMEGLMGGWMDG